MLSFLFLLLPLAFIFYCLVQKDKQILIPFLIGLGFAIVACAFKAFFTFTHRVIPYSFGQNLGFYLSQNLILPIILCVAYFVISRDSVDYKVNCFFPLICSYFMIALPYGVIAGTETVVYSGYEIFVKPVVCLAMLYQVAIDLVLLYEGIKSKYVLKIILNVIFIIAYLILPAFLDTLYVMGVQFYLLLAIAAVYVVSPIVFFVYRNVK